ncbi:MAG: hypothetical protein HC905_08185 [Bacteroidales bacterium]|nr:hypothetical protein [Bacteroidales bacterium]
MLGSWRSEDNPGNGIIQRAAGPSGTTWLSRDRSSFMVFDASYLNINNITLGYSLKKIASTFDARVYLSLQNAMMITKYPGANPETSRSGLNARFLGLDDAPYPVPRIYSLGVILVF